MVDATVRAPFESSPGWGAYFQRDLPRAVTELGSDPVGQARLHTEYAAFYRQALLMYAHATHHVYGERLRESDPVSVPYFRGVSRWFLGDAEAARADLAMVPESAPSEIVERANLWQQLSSGTWPLTLSPGQFPEDLPPVTPGTVPELTGLPHYQIPEQSEDALLIDTADPMALYALTVWHEAAALAAVEGDATSTALVQTALDPWRLPVEAAPEANSEAASSEAASSGAVSDSWLFLSVYPSVSDMHFVSAAAGGGAEGGVSAVASWSDRSLLAAAVAPAIVDGQVDPQAVVDQAAALERQVKAEMAARAGQGESYHQGFAALAELAVLRAAMVVADANGQYRDAGILRLNALDLSEGPGWDPLFVVSVAAWSAGNQNTIRAEELVHKLTNQYPSVEAARYPLDALHVRRSRESMQMSPAH